MRQLTIILSIATIAILSSCNPRYYMPNKHNTPLLEEKGEAKLDLSGAEDRIEVQTAYAITDEIAVQINGGYFMGSREESEDNEYNNQARGSGALGELGVGYYKKFSEHWVAEVYALGAFGKMENHFSSDDTNARTLGDISANVIKFGIQPSFGFKSKHFTAALSSRLSNLRYGNIQGNLMHRGNKQVDYLKENSSTLLIEPAFTIGIGIEKIKVELQYGFSFNLTNPNFRQRHSYVSLGLNFRINQ